MNLADYISVLSDGEKIDGCQITTPDAVAIARLHFPSRAYCLVADWAILDLDVTTSQRKAITDRVRIPRHPDTQPTNIRTPVPRSFGQAVGAQRRRFALLV